MHYSRERTVTARVRAPSQRSAQNRGASPFRTANEALRSAKFYCVRRPRGSRETSRTSAISDSPEVIGQALEGDSPLAQMGCLILAEFRQVALALGDHQHCAIGKPRLDLRI